MTKTKQTPKWLWITKIFGTLGYISLLMQWGWSALLFLPSLLDNQQVKSFLLPQPIKQPEQIVRASDNFSILYGVVASIMVLTILALTVYVLAKLPGQIAKGGNKLVVTAASATLPILAQNKKLSVKKRQALTIRVSKLVKLTILLVPFVLLSLATVIPVSLPIEIVWVVGAILALGSLLWFSLEYLVAKLLAIDEQLLI